MLTSAAAEDQLRQQCTGQPAALYWLCSCGSFRCLLGWVGWATAWDETRANYNSRRASAAASRHGACATASRRHRELLPLEPVNFVQLEPPPRAAQQPHMPLRCAALPLPLLSLRMMCTIRVY